MNRNYHKLLVAFFLSSVGDWLYKLALPLFLYQKTGSPLIIAITYAITFVPYIVVTPFGGVIADRLSRRQMLIRGDYLSFILTFLLAILVMLHTQHLTILYTLVFLIAAVGCLYHPIFQSIIPELVEQKDFAKANAFISSAENMILLFGPACSGLLIAFLGPTLAILVDAFSFFISALLIQWIPANPALLNKAKLTLTNVFSDLKAGFVYSYQNPIIRFGCLLFIFANFGVQLVLANFIFYLANGLHLSSFMIGLIYTCVGLGAVVGSMIAPNLVKRLPSGQLILLGCLGQGIATCLLAFVHHWIGVGIAGALMFVCMSIVVVTYFTLRQKVVDNQFLGRVIATTRLISYCAIPFAAVIGGWLLNLHFHFTDLAAIGGGIMVLNALLGWLTPLNQNLVPVPTELMRD